jgi:signal transduction histidine kinase
MKMKQLWQRLPIAYKIFGLILIFLATVEIIATVFIWQFESKVLLEKEQQNLKRELKTYKKTLSTHFATLQEETCFLARLEIMDDIVAKDIDKRILTLLERKANDLEEHIRLIITDTNGTITIAPPLLLGKTIQSLKKEYLHFKAPIFASFNPQKQLGTLLLLYPLENLKHLQTDNPFKQLWLQSPHQAADFPAPNISDSLIVSEKLIKFLPEWSLFLAYQKNEALMTLQNIQKVQLYTFIFSTILLAIIIFFLSKKLTLPLLELLKSSEKALEAKSTFLSTISHELRTPLGSILNLTQHITLSPNIDDDTRKMLNGIETSAQHLLSMINNILQLSKLETKSIVVQQESINLKELWNEIFEIIEPLIIDKNIALSKKIVIYHENIVSDSNLIKQVMINLLSNAIKFTNKGKIEVSLTQSHKTYIFTVKDTGIGINKLKQKQLFTPFYQAHTNIDTLKNSSGLGLALSQKVAYLLGGKITIYSKGTNKGTVATFYFQGDAVFR